MNYSCNYMNFLAIGRNYERVTYNCRPCMRVFVWYIRGRNRNFA